MSREALKRDLHRFFLQETIVAERLTDKEYRVLKNTVRIIRLSGAQLNVSQEVQARKYERAVAAYEQLHPEARG